MRGLLLARTATRRRRVIDLVSPTDVPRGDAPTLQRPPASAIARCTATDQPMAETQMAFKDDEPDANVSVQYVRVDG